MKMNNLWASISAVVFTVASATTVVNAATINGEGASLPEIIYTGKVDKTIGVASKPLSIFGQVSGHTVNYAGTGSGAGKSAVIGNTRPFAGTDSPLTQDNYTQFKNGASGTAHTSLVQLPSIVGAVSVVYNIPNSSLNLSSATLAKIFAGQITDWSQVPGSNYSGQIKLVARSSGSGTTFSFVNHLNAYRSSLTGGKFFKVTEKFQDAVAGIGGVTFTGQATNGDLVKYVKDNVGTIGYAEHANALNAGVKVATIDNKSPNQLIDTSFLNNSNAILDGYTIANDDEDGTAIATEISGIPNDKKKFIKLVDPEAYADPVSGYPIVAVSYLLGYTNGNGTNLAPAKAALKAPYDQSIQNIVDTGPYKTGFQYIPSTVGNTLSTLVDSIQ